jgi:hypothetical protein
LASISLSSSLMVLIRILSCSISSLKQSTIISRLYTFP